MEHLPRICTVCGQEYYPVSANQKRCAKCNQERTLARGVVHHGTCIRCGKEYIAHSDWQKYCPDCGPIVRKETSHRWQLEHPSSEKRPPVYQTKRCERRICPFPFPPFLIPPFGKFQLLGQLLFNIQNVKLFIGQYVQSK